mmetsp:Transcript_21103/g.63493  ORF Transcript_21103/g.63493 Transcript_21103/m.63493 type:complete len:224 (-) Transcript_21103:1613-2284(-)
MTTVMASRCGFCPTPWSCRSHTCPRSLSSESHQAIRQHRLSCGCGTTRACQWRSRGCCPSSCMPPPPVPRGQGRCAASIWLRSAAPSCRSTTSNAQRTLRRTRRHHCGTRCSSGGRRRRRLRAQGRPTPSRPLWGGPITTFSMMAASPRSSLLPLRVPLLARPRHACLHPGRSSQVERRLLTLTERRQWHWAMEKQAGQRCSGGVAAAAVRCRGQLCAPSSAL